MRSAQSRLGVVTSLGAARRGVGRCVEALPVPVSALKAGGAAIAGFAGAAMLRGLFRRKKKAPAAPPAASPTSRRSMGVLFSETALTLLLPLLRRYLLGVNLPADSAAGAVDKLLSRTGR